MKNTIVFSYLALFSTLGLFSCDKEDDTFSLPKEVRTTEELTTALNEIQQASEAPGFTVSIVKNDAIIYQQSFGKANLENNQAYTNQTIQPIGSISKTFVAAAIVKAIEQGYFTLETDINSILPESITNPHQPNELIKVKHLITHTSGLLDVQEAYFQAYRILPGENLSTDGSQLLQNGLGIQQRTGIPLEEFLAEYYLETGDLYSSDNFASIAPGANWAYSNIATSLAAYLVETATETPFEEYVLTNILQVLNMTNTAYALEYLNTSKLATLYWDRNTPLPKYANDSYPDGGLYTNNEDLSKYLLDMMKGAKGESTTLFTRESYALLFKALLPNGITPISFAENHGVFWFLKDGMIKHDGADPGNTSILEFNESGQSGYFLLSNMDASTEAHEAAWSSMISQVQQVITEFLQAN